MAAESAARQILQGVYRFTLAANLKMELHPIGTRGSHFGDMLSDFDLLSLPHQQPAVMSVGAYVGIAVFDDYQFAVAP
ncbi:hypothetical protein A0T30_17065 [Aquipseudomonas alcaligenes]|nr:hypothetical protein A0T30_17065 [Pseudomonas alcaligenes]